MPPPQVRLELDAALLRITYEGEVSDALMMQTIRRFAEEHPEVAECDSLLDLRRYHHSISANALQHIAAGWTEMFGRPRRTCHTAIVATAPAYRIMQQLLRDLFPGREFAVFDTLADAERWLAADRGAGHFPQPASRPPSAPP
jgi:hypothetical protein